AGDGARNRGAHGGGHRREPGHRRRGRRASGGRKRPRRRDLARRRHRRARPGRRPPDRRAFGSGRHPRQQRGDELRARPRRADRRRLAGPVRAQRDGAAAADAGLRARHGGARLGEDRQRRVVVGKAPLADQRRLLGDQGGRAVAVPRLRGGVRGKRRARQRGGARSGGGAAVAGRGGSRRSGGGGAGHHARARPREPGGQGADRAPDHPRRGGRGGRLPVLGGGVGSDRGGLVGGRRDGAGNHL
ncbi:MAG: hypothetical protein AVDCRST_MAG65-1890, partial [uncultured Solirubrobacteraceae bacterium]